MTNKEKLPTPGVYWFKVTCVASGVGTGPIFPPKEEVLTALQAGITTAGIDATVEN